MKLLKEILFRGVKGMVIGVFLIYTIGFTFILVSGEKQIIDSSFFMKQYIAGAGIGFTFGALNLLFKIEKLGIIGSTVSHFIGLCIVFFPMAYYANWIGNNAMTVIESVLMLMISYFFIWIICYLGWKKEINSINRSLEDNMNKEFTNK